MSKPAFPLYIARALQDMDHEVFYLGKDFYDQFKLEVKIPSKLANYYDVFIYSNGLSKIVNLVNVPRYKNKIFLYYESYAVPFIPNGTNFIFSNPVLFELLMYACFPQILKFKGKIDMDVVKCLCVPGSFKPKEKIHAFRYNGNLDRPITKILGAWMKERINFCNDLKKLVPNFELPKKNENWIDSFEKTVVNLHISSDWGCGQGVLESIMCECLLIEYPRTKYSFEYGLIDGVNCFLVNSPKEAYEKYYMILRMSDEERLDMIEKSKRLLTRHSYKNLIPILNKYF